MRFLSHESIHFESSACLRTGKERCAIYAALFPNFRVYLEYHTWWQVVCGCGVGVAFALAWFALVHYVFTPFFPQIVQW